MNGVVMMVNLIEDLKLIFTESEIYFEFEEKKNHRFLFRWNEVMRDAGMVADNVILDFNMDSIHEGIFLGLIRIPHPYRGKRIGEKVVKLFKQYAKENHFSILLESAPENIIFWQKMHFSSFLFEEYGFWMMGYGGKNKQHFRVKWSQMKPVIYSDVS